MLEHVSCALLQDISLKELPNVCMPPTKAGNNLAEMKKKQIKTKVAKPFPFVDLVDFVPSWATKVRTLRAAQDGWLVPCVFFSQVDEDDAAKKRMTPVRLASGACAW